MNEEKLKQLDHIFDGHYCSNCHHKKRCHKDVIVCNEWEKPHGLQVEWSQASVNLVEKWASINVEDELIKMVSDEMKRALNEHETNNT